MKVTGARGSTACGPIRKVTLPYGHEDAVDEGSTSVAPRLMALRAFQERECAVIRSAQFLTSAAVTRERAGDSGKRNTDATSKAPALSEVLEIPGKLVV